MLSKDEAFILKGFVAKSQDKSLIPAPEFLHDSPHVKWVWLMNTGGEMQENLVHLTSVLLVAEPL